MNCQDVSELLIAYLDGEITSSERKLIQAHLAGCGVCQRELAALSATQNRVSRALQIRAAQAVPSPQAWSRLQARLAGEARPSPSWFLRLVSGIWHTLKARRAVKQKLALVAAALVATVAVVFIASPPVRSWAQEIIDRVQGLITITDGPPWVERVREEFLRGGQSGIEERYAEPGWPDDWPLDEVQAVAGFPIRLPAYLPAGYHQSYLQPGPAPYVGLSQAERNAWEYTFVLAIFNDGAEGHWFTLAQAREFEEDELAVGQAEVHKVTVNGQSGMWVEPFPSVLAENLNTGERRIEETGFLFWKEEGVAYRMQIADPDITLEEAIRITESLMP